MPVLQLQQSAMYSLGFCFSASFFLPISHGTRPWFSGHSTITLGNTHCCFKGSLYLLTSPKAIPGCAKPQKKDPKHIVPYLIFSSWPHRTHPVKPGLSHPSLLCSLWWSEGSYPWLLDKICLLQFLPFSQTSETLGGVSESPSLLTWCAELLFFTAFTSNVLQQGNAHLSKATATKL